MDTKKFVLKSIISLVLTILFVTLLSFLLMRLSPVSPAEAYAKRYSAIVSEAQIKEAEIKLGLDKPLMVQYFTWLSKAIRGDLGYSLSNGNSIIFELSKTVPKTLSVVFISTIIMVMGIFIFSYILYKCRHNFFGKLFNGVSIVFISIPAFSIAVLFINIFMVKYKIFSISSSQGLVRYLPAAICIALFGIAFYSQLLALELDKEMKKDYVFFAKSRGLSENRILIFHALPYSVIELLPSFAQMIGLTIANATIIEQIFSIPGIGYKIVEAVISRDAPYIHAIVLFLAVSLALLDFIAETIKYFLRRA